MGSLGRLFAELRRRRVVRVLVVYAVAGWLVIQVAATVMPSLHLPEWSVTLVIALVVLGLPIALAIGVFGSPCEKAASISKRS